MKEGGIRLIKDGEEWSPPLIPDAVSLTVTPFDRAALENSCAELFAPMRDHTDVQEIPLSARTAALYSVRHDVALPFLAFRALYW